MDSFWDNVGTQGAQKVPSSQGKVTSRELNQHYNGRGGTKSPLMRPTVAFSLKDKNTPESQQPKGSAGMINAF